METIWTCIVSMHGKWWGVTPLGVRVRHVHCGGSRVVIRMRIVCVFGWLREVTPLDVQILCGSGGGVVVCVCELMGVIRVCIVCV